MSRQASPGELDPAPGTEVVPELRARTQDKVPGLEAECGPRRDSWADPKEGSVGPITGPWMLPTGRKGEAATVKLHPEPIPGSGMLRFGTGRWRRWRPHPEAERCGFIPGSIKQRSKGARRC